MSIKWIVAVSLVLLLAAGLPASAQMMGGGSEMMGGMKEMMKDGMHGTGPSRDLSPLHLVQIATLDSPV